MCSARDKNPLNTPIGTFGKMFKAVLSERSLLPVYGILENHKNGLSCSLLLRSKNSVPYYHFRILWYIVSAGLDY